MFKIEIKATKANGKKFERTLTVIQCSFETVICHKDNEIILYPLRHDEESLNYITWMLKEVGSQVTSMKEIG